MSRVRLSPRAVADLDEIAPGIRMAVHTNYLIFFRHLPNEIRIDRVLHGARNMPRLWKS